MTATHTIYPTPDTARSTTILASDLVTTASPVRLAGVAIKGRHVVSAPRSQGYYWTPEWQAMEAAAEAELAAGREMSFDSMQDAIAALHAAVAGANDDE